MQFITKFTKEFLAFYNEVILVNNCDISLRINVLRKKKCFTKEKKIHGDYYEKERGN